ncbi:MAG: peptidylprolyl isomerase [Elusimicrobia bacterium]|nr:peptidylprolyl isomerase [Elusimicrobiota bacterium]
MNSLALAALLALGAHAADGTLTPLTPAPERLLLRTSKGDMVFALYPDVAPKHVAQVLALAKAGVFDSVYFERVLPGFIAQTCRAQNRTLPLYPDQLKLIKPLPPEFNKTLPHRRGMLSMNRHPDKPDSAESSFFIVLGDQPGLNGRYTTFGELERGEDVLRAIERDPRKPGPGALPPLEIEHALALDPTALKAVRSRPPAAAAPLAATAAGRPPLWTAAALVVMCLFGSAAFLIRNHASTRTLGALGLLSTLTGAFALYALWVPSAKGHPWGSVAIFAATLGLFKLMNRFEASR